MTAESEFKAVFSDVKWSDAFYRFLQVVYRLYPEDRFHYLLASTAKEKNTDEEIYKEVQRQLPSIKPFLSEVTYSLPSLKKQKNEMTRQALQLLGNRTRINGYVEIGSTGRYASDLRKHVRIDKPIFIVNDVAPSNSLADIFERGQLAKLGMFVPLNDYAPIDHAVANESIDLVTCYIGLHHATPETLDGFVRSIHRVLRPGGLFIMRDHDVRTPEMATFVSLVHTVFNLGLNVPWETDRSEFKCFLPIDQWCATVCAAGFTDTKHRLLQDKDPSDNTLVSFVKK